jgi:hypothetical protein
MTLKQVALALGFAVTETDKDDITAIEAKHPGGALVRTWLLAPDPSRPTRIVQLDAPHGEHVPHAIRLALGQLGGSTPERVTVTVGGPASQEHTWRQALALAKGGAWGFYAPPSKAARWGMEDAGARRLCLQLRQMLSEITDAASLECVTPELLARCAEMLSITGPGRVPAQERSAPRRKQPARYDAFVAALEGAQIETYKERGDPVPRDEVRLRFTPLAGIADRGNCTRMFESCLAYALETGAATMAKGMIREACVSPTA